MSAPTTQQIADDVGLALKVIAGVCRRARMEGFDTAPVLNNGALLLARDSLPAALQAIRRRLHSQAAVVAPLDRLEADWIAAWCGVGSLGEFEARFRERPGPELAATCISLLTRVRLRVRSLGDSGRSDAWSATVGEPSADGAAHAAAAVLHAEPSNVDIPPLDPKERKDASWTIST